MKRTLHRWTPTPPQIHPYSKLRLILGFGHQQCLARAAHLEALFLCHNSVAPSCGPAVQEPARWLPRTMPGSDHRTACPAAAQWVSPACIPSPLLIVAWRKQRSWEILMTFSCIFLPKLYFHCLQEQRGALQTNGKRQLLCYIRCEQN